MTTEDIEREYERRYAFFRGEHPDRAKVRETLESEPMAKWLALEEIRREMGCQ
jgi:hypothetical protein